MTGHYKSLVTKVCPNADVTVDRFHVTKMLQEEFNQARIAQKKAASALKVKEITKLFYCLKVSKYILMKAAIKLSEPQKQKLKKVKNAAALLGIMHELKEEFHALFI
ncbi:transposase [Microcoleus sp. BROC3]|uniref:transposase n=1 Tax=Microcoleus sp. BROC3 TaxID=3055323 RepID=UPI002FD0872B